MRASIQVGFDIDRRDLADAFSGAGAPLLALVASDLTVDKDAAAITAAIVCYSLSYVSFSIISFFIYSSHYLNFNNCNTISKLEQFLVWILWCNFDCNIFHSLMWIRILNHSFYSFTTSWWNVWANELVPWICDGRISRRFCWSRICNLQPCCFMATPVIYYVCITS